MNLRCHSAAESLNQGSRCHWDKIQTLYRLTRDFVTKTTFISHYNRLYFSTPVWMCYVGIFCPLRLDYPCPSPLLSPGSIKLLVKTPPALGSFLYLSRLYMAPLIYAPKYSLVLPLSQHLTCWIAIADFHQFSLMNCKYVHGKTCLVHYIPNNQFILDTQ